MTTGSLFQQKNNPPAPPAPRPADTVRHQPGSATSKAGADQAAMTGKSATQLSRYLASLWKAGDRGLTDHEAAEILGLPIASICARRGSKHAQQYVEDSGNRRKGPTGVANVAWKHNRGANQ